MTIVPMLVKVKNSDQCVATYAFLDNGCGAVFVNKELSDTLHVRTRATKLFLRTINLEETVDTETTLDQLQIGSIDGTTFIDLPDAYIKDIPVDEQEILTQRDINKWKHMQSVKLPKLDTTQACLPKVTMMIGINVPAATTPLETRVGDIGQPYAVKSPLGWLVYGLPGRGKTTDVHFCSATSIQKSNQPLEQSLHKQRQR